MSVAATFPSLESLRATLNITNRELGMVLGQSREVVDGWFNGVAPDEIDAPRIAQLRQAMQALVAAGVPVSAQTLRRKVPGGASILSAISRGDNLQAVIDRLNPSLTRETGQRERLTKQTAGRRRPAFDPGTFGAPALAEKSGVPIRTTPTHPPSTGQSARERARRQKPPCAPRQKGRTSRSAPQPPRRAGGADALNDTPVQRQADIPLSQPQEAQPGETWCEGACEPTPLLFLDQDSRDVRRNQAARAALSVLFVLLVDVDNVGKAPSVSATRELIWGKTQRHLGRTLVAKIAGKTRRRPPSVSPPGGSSYCAPMSRWPTLRCAWCSPGWTRPMMRWCACWRMCARNHRRLRSS